MAVVYIGLGSNMGNRRENLQNAVVNIMKRTGAAILAQSSIKQTKAVGFVDQPDFLNQIIKTETDINPRDLLKILKEIETEMGRIYRFPKGPREIDLDILLYGSTIINEIDLKVPHPEILKRGFILEHLVELDPELADPVSKEKYSKICNF